MNSDIHNRFTYHSPSAEQARIYETARDKVRELAEWMDETAPNSRELNQAITSLDQAIMWFNASIARNSN